MWSPVHSKLEERLNTGDPLCLLIVSFIKLDALKRLIGAADHWKKLKVIVRWRVQDIMSGSSDLEIYEFLRDHKISLYYNERIHLKLYIFESNTAFNTSGNLTSKGLGYSLNGNIEVGAMVILTDNDWESIYELINQSTPVDDALYQKMQYTIDSIPKPPVPRPLPAWPANSKKLFTIQAFPASPDVDYLIDYYSSTDRTKFSSEEKQRAIHDLIAFKLPKGLNRNEARNVALANFRETEFVKAFVAELRSKKFMRFGSVAAWVHDKCEDVPLPYRWEIKQSVNRLYIWLTAAFTSITWDQPNVTEVIYWNKLDRG